MKGRCKDKDNRNYGGKGIMYTTSWESFSSFWEDMGDSYKDNLTLDRIDNLGNYSKSNCRWATYKEQMRNFSGNTHISHNGETKILSDWALEIGITKQAFIKRLNTFKNCPDKIFAKGKKTTRGFPLLSKTEWVEIKRLLAKGYTQTYLAGQFNLTQSAISKHIKRNETTNT